MRWPRALSFAAGLAAGVVGLAAAYAVLSRLPLSYGGPDAVLALVLVGLGFPFAAGMLAGRVAPRPRWAMAAAPACAAGLLGVVAAQDPSSWGFVQALLGAVVSGLPLTAALAGGVVLGARRRLRRGAAALPPPSP